MRYQLVLHIADMKKNAFMEAADLKPRFKVYATPEMVSFTAKKKPDEGYIRDLINKSKNMDVSNGFWIPAVTMEGTLYCHESIKILSDGEKEYFVNKFTKEECDDG